MCRHDCFRHLLHALCVLTFVACNKFEYHPYDGRIKGRTNINADNISKIEKACAGKDSVRFAVISDIQRRYDDTKDLVAAINAIEGVDFVINLGDITDFGETKEFVAMRDILGKLKMPYVCLIGNHDCLGTGKHVFRTVFGNENFAFTAGATLFVCINTNSREYDYTTAVPDFAFLSKTLGNRPPEAANTVVAMHAAPGSEQFDNNIADVFEERIRRFPNLLFCLNGHGHHVTANDIFGDGTIYYGCANAARRSFLLFGVGKNGYSRDVVEL